MKRFLIYFTGLLFAINFSYANFSTFMEVQNINVNGGTIYVAIYFKENSFIKRAPEISFHFEPTKSFISQPLNLDNGNYLIGVHQDTNGNGQMDYNFLGIPKEPYGFSNMKGKVPGKFDEMKVNINSKTRNIIVPLVAF